MALASTSRDSVLQELPAEVLGEIIFQVLQISNFPDFLALRLVCNKFDHEVRHLIRTRPLLNDTERRQFGTRSQLTYAHWMPPEHYANYLKDKVLLARKDSNEFADLTKRVAKDFTDDLVELGKVNHAEWQHTYEHAIWSQCWLFVNNPNNVLPWNPFNDVPIELTQVPKLLDRWHVSALKAYAGLALDPMAIDESKNGPPKKNMLFYCGTVLNAAILGGQLATVELLLDAGVKPCYNARNGASSRALACRHGHFPIVELLSRPEYAAKSDPFEMKTEWITSVEQAAAGGHQKIVDYLLQDEFEQALLDSYGDNNRGIKDEILGIQSKVLLLAVRNGQARLVESSLAEGADESAFHNVSDGPSPLRTACLAGNTDVVRILLAHGYSAAGEGEPYDRKSMQAAANHGHVEIMKLLLQAGVDINWPKDGPGFGWAVGAAKRGQLRAVELLLREGLDITLEQGKRGEAIARAAARSGYVSIARLLIDSGVKKEVVLEEAKAHHQSNVLQAFSESGYG